MLNYQFLKTHRLLHGKCMHIYAYDFDSQTLIDVSHISHSDIHQFYIYILHTFNK